MAMKTRKCLCCGTHYSYCPDCNSADRLKPSYFATFCSEDCKTLWDSLTKFNFGTLTKSEAKSIISTIELKPIDTYAACVQRDLEKVMAEEPKPKRGRRAELKIFEEAFAKTTIDELPEFVLEATTENVLEPIVEELTEDVAHYEVVLTEEEN